MSGFDLELLSDDHARKGLRCGNESLERYLRETAKDHLTQGVSITRVMVERSARKPKPILGYFTLTSTLAKAANWPGTTKSLPSMPVPIVLLGSWRWRRIDRTSLTATQQGPRKIGRTEIEKYEDAIAKMLVSKNPVVRQYGQLEQAANQAELAGDPVRAAEIRTQLAQLRALGRIEALLQQMNDDIWRIKLELGVP